jgi:hypothetical protein
VKHGVHSILPYFLARIRNVRGRLAIVGVWCTMSGERFYTPGLAHVAWPAVWAPCLAQRNAPAHEVIFVLDALVHKTIGCEFHGLAGRIMARFGGGQCR